MASRLLTDRDVVRDVATFIAKWTRQEPLEVERQLKILGAPERAMLLERASVASGRHAVGGLARALLWSPARAPHIRREAQLVDLLALLCAELMPGVLLEASTLDPSFDTLCRLAEHLPSLPVALAIEPEALAHHPLTRSAEHSAASGHSARDRMMLREGLVHLDEPLDEPHGEHCEHITALREQLVALAEAATDDPQTADRARSLAERLLYEALERHPVTRGRFELNSTMPFTFGNRPAEIDLLSRRDRLAVEIDGYYHFVDDDAYRRDRRKDALLQRHGLFVLRFLAQDVGPRLTEIVERIVDTLYRPTPRLSHD
ncbi:MAG: DUF559 domain-containing protein [Myxococcota bacterium]